jgi:protein SCO1
LIQIKAFSLSGGFTSGVVFSRQMRSSWIWKSALALQLIVALAACSRSEKQVANERRYETRGIVRGFAPDRSTIEIEHESIPDFMPSMTMPFSPKDPSEISGLQRGDAISFRLTVTDKDSLIDQIRKIDAREVQLPAPMKEVSSPPKSSDRLREGDIMPEFTLIDQDGRTITLNDYRGRPFVLTFIFTRCPLPNFCPLMSQHFAALQSAIEVGTDPVAGTRLLSISFDPDFDSPDVLKTFAAGEHANPKVWKFATGTKPEIEKLTREFSVFVQPEGGSISHGLVTALIDRNGRIAKIWRGNGWTPEEVVRELHSLPE